MHKTRKGEKVTKHENEKSEKCEKCNHKTWKSDKNRGGLNPALKPGPVVPPGIEKTPDQAARKTQSVDFAHLSDILAFFRGGRFLTLFLITFSLLWFYHFWWFSLFVFCHFLHFLHFLDFVLFDDLWFLMIFVTFSCCDQFLVNYCVKFKCLIHDTLFS